MNFLVFIADQLCAAHLGCYGNPIVATPHIDALARRGWRATECHVASPICMPNRASLLTGRMPSVHGVRHNGIPLSLGATTFVERLRDAGFTTFMVGKSHLQNMTVKRPLPAPGAVPLSHDAQRRHPGNYLQESEGTWHGRDDVELDLPFYGFEHAELAIGHGDALEGHYRRWLQSAHPDAMALVGRANARPSPDVTLAGHGQAWRTRVPESLHPSAWIAQRTIAQLRAARASGRPFFGYCSFPDPHHPYTPPGRYWDLYRPEDVDLPPSFRSASPPPHLAWLRAQRDEGKAVKHTMACFAATEREAREALALGYGSISFIDAQIGAVLAALQDLGLANDTVVLFTTDHGEFGGDHQLLFKGSLHYRSLIRTPLVWYDPALPGGRAHDGLLSTIDIAPTVLDRAGVEGYNGMQGRSFLPSIRAEETVEREALVIEEEGQRTYYGFDRPVRMRTLLTREHRLSVYDGVPWGELYARREDPWEQHNLWGDPGHQALEASLMGLLARRMLAHADRSPAPTALA